MKKLFTLMLVAAMYSATAQNDFEFGFGIGVSSINADPVNASRLGLALSMSFGKFYIDYVSNYASGDGDFLEFSSSSTYKVDKVQTGVINVGYMFYLKSFYVLPVVGVQILKDIYQDPVGWDTYYYGEAEIKPGIGAMVGIRLGDGMSMHAGASTMEKFKLGVAFYF